MSDADFSLTYPPVHPGTAVSRIRFYNTAPDLAAVFSTPAAQPAGRRIFVTDTTIAALPAVRPFISLFADGSWNGSILVTLPAGEAAKTLDNVMQIIKHALEHNFNRNDIFTAIGGGVISDMTAFASAIFKRGARCEIVPTTLLAMVDAAVGGKTGCDYDSYKNMIGAFYPAEQLYFFPRFIETLPESEYRSGLAEAVKTALLYSKELYTFIKDNSEKIKRRDPKLLADVITRCVKAKAAVVEQDFTEKNIRMYLNLGHTFGHALESTAGLGKITHGDAVAWGIGRAAAVSLKLGLCTRAYYDNVTALLAGFGWETNPCPDILKAGSSGSLLAAMKKDKKNSGSAVKLILQKDIEQTVIRETDDATIMQVLS